MQPLVARHLEVLYARDPAGRLVATRDVTPRPAPRLHLVRSAEGNAWALRADVSPDVAEMVTRACAGEPPGLAPAPCQPPVCRARVCELLAPVSSEWRGPAYVLPDTLPTDERARLLPAGEAAVWSGSGPFPWLRDEYGAIQPVAIAFEDGCPASICHAPRGSTEAASEAGVETLAPFRGRGLAAAAVACWARAVQRTGRLALYSTSWENAASRALARRLGARLYGEDWWID